MAAAAMSAAATTGAGMPEVGLTPPRATVTAAAACRTAAGMNAYILADRASWLNFANKADLAIAFEGDPVLFNQYAYIPVNPEKHAHVKADAAAKLEAWLTSPRAKELIENYQIGGQQLFVFNASTK